MENNDVSLSAPRYAGFWVRFLAYIIDTVLIYAVIYIIAAVMVPEVVDPTSTDEKMKQLGALNRVSLLAILIYFGYEIILTASKLQGTIGKKACGLKVVNERGQRISLMASIFRYIGKILSSMILCIGFLMIAFSAKKRGLHDNLANTYVVKA